VSPLRGEKPKNRSVSKTIPADPAGKKLEIPRKYLVTFNAVTIFNLTGRSFINKKMPMKMQL